MKKTYFLALSLITAAGLSGCNSTTHNSFLTDAHNSYNSAQSNPQVTNLAVVELKEAGDSLSKADSALKQGESEATVNQLAYIANQQVAIAQETARRKAAELAVSNATANRNQVRLEARTAEADAAKKQVAIVQATADQQAEELAAASANARSDQALIAKQEQQLRELNAKKTNRGVVVTLGDVLFNSNKSELKSGGTRNVQKLADFLKQYPQRNVLIEGYTDSTGSESLNQALSERRANSVKAALIDLGITSDRVATRGYGKEFPVAGNDTAANRQMNRRVEVIFSDDNGKITPR
jgi:outer membrane protein OmpA-like peptidoglycan-associated protein